jgi:hypothetical protein
MGISSGVFAVRRCYIFVLITIWAICLFLKRIVMLKCRQCVIIPESWPGTGMTREGDFDLIGTSSLTTAPV